METHYAVIDNGLVVNTVVWDGVSDYNPGENVALVPLPYTTDDDGEIRYTGGIGWDYMDGTFVDNRPEPEE
jgi:hypothetical protein